MTTYTSQPDGTDGIDTALDKYQATANFGTLDFLYAGIYGSDPSRSLIKFDLSKGTNPPLSTAKVSSVTFSIYCTAYNTPKTLALYQCLRAWVESEATWNIWSTGNNWTTAGAASDGNDYSSTSLGSVSISGTGSFDVSLNASGIAVVQGWIDGSIANNGFVIRHTSEADNYNEYASSDHATSSYRPKLVIEYIYGGNVMIWSNE